MKYICPKCNRVSKDGNLWCQEKYCPAENALEIFDNGEWFSQIEIIEPLSIFRTAAIYKARRNETKILLKVAHNGFEEKLKRESLTLAELNEGKQHTMLPKLLPAHEQADVKNFPYGKIVLRGKTKYYAIYEYAEGDILKNYLLKNPQPWYQHAGWLTISLADVVLLMHQNRKLHLCLSPDIVLIHFDKENIPRPLLLDLGIAANPEEINSLWNLNLTLPHYTAPELIKMQGNVGTRSDVYGLGLILYEMLAGKPAYEHKLLKDEEIYQEILASKPLKTGRNDLKHIPEITEKAIKSDYSSRQKDVLSFAKELQNIFPSVPKEKKGFKINWRSVAIVIGAAMVISLLLVLAAFFQSG